jgi:probable rRNA maturation factor
VEEFVVRASVKEQVSTRAMRTWMKRVSAELGLSDDVTFVLTDDDEVHALNKEYRGYDRPTDVLAFAMREGDHAAHRGGMLGDVIVSVPTAAKQARAAKRPFEDELLMLLVHGLLHLLGWDHDTKKKDTAMRAETERLMKIARQSTKLGPKSRKI